MFAQTSKTGKCVITINTVSSSHGEPVRLTKSVPASGAVIAFKSGDVLIGNIRPYLKKIWLADCDGGTNAVDKASFHGSPMAYTTGQKEWKITWPMEHDRFIGLFVIIEPIFR